MGTNVGKNCVDENGNGYLFGGAGSVCFCKCMNWQCNVKAKKQIGRGIILTCKLMPEVLTTRCT